MAGESDRNHESLSDLEKTQEALRKSIEETKALAEKSQRLLDAHRRASQDAK